MAIVADTLPVVRVCLVPRKSPALGKRAKDKEAISLEYQEERMREWCTRMGPVDGCVYRVVAVRPETDHRYLLKSRSTLMGVIEDCKAGLYDLILCYDMTRFTADGDDIGWLSVELRDAGAGLRFVFNDPGQGPYARTIRTIQADGSGEEVATIRRRTGEGKQKRKTVKKLCLPRPAAYGLIWNHEADPSTAPLAEQRYAYLQPRGDETSRVARRVLEELASGGTTMGQLVRRLNEERIPAPQGGEWTRAGLAVVVHNPAYCGIEATGRTRSRLAGLGYEKRWVKDRKPESEWEILEVVHRPLVTVQTWRAAQDAVAGRVRRASRTPGGPSDRCLMLGGLATCAKCDRPLWQGGQYRVVEERPGTAPAGTTVVYYQCSSTHSVTRDAILAGRGAPCTAPATVRADLLDGAVWRAVLDYQPPAPPARSGESEAKRRAAERRRLTRQVVRLARELEAGERRLLLLDDPLRVAAMEAVQATASAELGAAQRALEALAGEERTEAVEDDRARATFEALWTHRERLLACRPWGADPGQDEAMRGLVRALGVRAVVTRPPRARDRRTPRWAISVGAQVGVTGEESTARRGFRRRKPAPPLAAALRALAVARSPVAHPC